MRMRHTVISGLPRSTIFFLHYLINSSISGGELLNINVCFDFLYKFRMKIFPLYAELSKTWSKLSSGLPVKYRLFLSDCNETWIFEKSSCIKFHKTPSSGSGAVWCGETDGRTYIHNKAKSSFSQFCQKRPSHSFFSDCSGPQVPVLIH